MKDTLRSYSPINIRLFPGGTLHKAGGLLFLFFSLFCFSFLWGGIFTLIIWDKLKSWLTFIYLRLMKEKNTVLPSHRNPMHFQPETKLSQAHNFFNTYFEQPHSWLLLNWMVLNCVRCWGGNLFLCFTKWIIINSFVAVFKHITFFCFLPSLLPSCGSSHFLSNLVSIWTCFWANF